MHRSKKNTTAMVLIAAAALFVLLAQIGVSGDDQSAFKLEGAWIAKIPGTPGQWTYTFSPDSSGRKATVFGTIQVALQPASIYLGLFEDVEFNSSIIGEVILVGNDIAVFNSIWYGVKRGFPFDQIVYIGMNSGQIVPTGPGKAEGTHNLMFYDPSSDGDGDGLPDPGEEPVLVVPDIITVETRLPL
jgi:hypothetical protein